jgi:hypothetical protein
VPSISDSTPTAGSTVTISGGGFAPGSTVTVTIGSGSGGLTQAAGDAIVTGTAAADASGNFSITLRVPAGTPAGDYAVVATGVAPDGTRLALRSTVTVTAAVPGGGLPFTGDNATSTVWVALAVLALGAVLVIGSRQRRLAHLNAHGTAHRAAGAAGAAGAAALRRERLPLA